MTCNENNDYIDELILNGFMFHYHYEEPNKNCINVIPKEILQIFNKYFSITDKEIYLKKIMIRYIDNYLAITGYTPKAVLKDFILNSKEINISNKKFEELIKEANLKTYKDNYTVLPPELCEIIEQYKLDYQYKSIAIADLEEYILMLGKLLDDILLILDIKDNTKEIMNKITLSFKLCLGYNQLENAGKEIQTVFNISDEKRDMITDLINEYKYELRFWNINGSSIEEYRNNNFLQKGVLKNSPKKNDIKSCLKELSKEGKDLIRIYFDIKSNEIDDIKAEILNNMENVLEDFNIDYLDELLNIDNKPYSNYIYSDLLYSGLLYLYKDNDKLKVLISDEAKKKIREILKANDNLTQIGVLTNRYLKENGVISIDKLVSILNNYHSQNTTKDQIIEITQRQGVPLKMEKYLVYSSGLTDFDIENILRKKELISDQHIIKFEEPDFIEDFLTETDEYLMYLPKNDKEIISSYFFSMILLGTYNRKYFKEILKENNLEKHMNALDDIAIRYKNNVGIWTLNGFSQKQFEEKRKEQKVGRNDPCPCGSGLKYKKCCGKT